MAFALPPPVTAGPGIPMNTLSTPQHSTPPFSPYGSPLTGTNPTSNVAYPSAVEKTSAPWKYEGYKEFAKWMASEDDFFLFRRFGRLNAAAILWMQDQITEIEERLDQLHDDMCQSSPFLPNGQLNPNTGRNSSFRWDSDNLEERDELMMQLSHRLHQYNKYIEAYAKVRQRPKAESRQIRNVVNWLQRNAISPKESEFKQREGDLIAINPKSTPPLERFLRSCRIIRLSRFLKAKLRTDTHVESKHTHYSSDGLMTRLSNISIMLLGFAMLMGPHV